MPLARRITKENFVIVYIFCSQPAPACKTYGGTDYLRFAVVLRTTSRVSSST